MRCVFVWARVFGLFTLIFRSGFRWPNSSPGPAETFQMKGASVSLADPRLDLGGGGASIRGFDPGNPLGADKGRLLAPGPAYFGSSITGVDVKGT